MNNKTRIRLHLSKNLFESLSREILAEAKVNGGGAYTVAVKTPKTGKIKEVNAMADTDKMKKMEEKMSSKEKMAKGLYNEVDAEMDTNKMRTMEEGPKVKHDVESLKKAKAKIEKKLAEMQINVAEEDNVSEVKSADEIKMNDIYFFTQSTDKYGQSGKAAPIKVKVLSAYNDEWFSVEVQENGPDHKRGEKIKASYVNLFPLTTHFSGSNEPIDEKSKAAGTHLHKPQAPPSLNELRKQVKK